jgi:hypothetical protein
MNEKLSVNLTGKDAAKLLEGLTKDPQLRSEDDPSILAEEQFPTDHHALLLLSRRQTTAAKVMSRTRHTSRLRPSGQQLYLPCET